MSDEASPAEVRLNAELGADRQKSERHAFWAFFLAAQMWFAAGWVGSGWWPFVVGTVWLTLAALVLWTDGRAPSA